MTRQTKEIKKFYLPVKNKTNESTYCKAELKQGCQVGNKAMKTKLTNMLRGKERKNRYAKLNRGRWSLYTLKINWRGKGQ